MPSANSSAAAETFSWQLLALLLLVSMPASAADEPVLAGRVTRVIDGDTLDVLLASGRIRVRLHGVDAPERDQPSGREASEWLRQRVQDREVLLEPVTQDRYERMVAIVLLDDANVNRELLRAGHAWAYRSYLRRPERIYCDIQRQCAPEALAVYARYTRRGGLDINPFRSSGEFPPPDNAREVRQ